MMTRQQIESEIDRLIGLLDQLDGDPDFEPEPVEEQHDAEAELTWTERAPPFFVLAENARRKARLQ